jgi:hypothetical protein
MVIARPVAIQETKKCRGIRGEYQSGCILPGIMRKSDPRDD